MHVNDNDKNNKVAVLAKKKQSSYELGVILKISGPIIHQIRNQDYKTEQNVGLSKELST